MSTIPVFGGPLDGEAIPFQGKRLRIALPPKKEGEAPRSFGYVARRYTRWLNGERQVIRVYEIDTAGPQRWHVRQRFDSRSMLRPQR